MCLVCGTRVAVFKEYNLNRHYTTKHEDKYRKLSGEERARESDALLAKLQTQRGFFTKLHTPRDAAVRTSYVISHKIARKSKAFSDGEFIKECLLDSAALMCPEKKGAFENVSLSRRTVTRRIEDIAGNLELQLQLIKGTTTGNDLFREVNACMAMLGLKWDKLAGVTTDGCPNLTGKNVGLLKRMQDKVTEMNPDQK